jgi:hypothetical protein
MRFLGREVVGPLAPVAGEVDEAVIDADAQPDHGHQVRHEKGDGMTGRKGR